MSKPKIILLNFKLLYTLSIQLKIINLCFRQMLKPHGIILPEKMSIQCMLVNSKWLPYVCKVIENNDSCNSHIRDLMNIYSVSNIK